MKKKFLFFIAYWLPVLLLAALIYKFSAGTVPTVTRSYWGNFAAKKSAHFLVFGVLAILIYRALIASGVSKKKAIIYSVLLATFYGATDEYHQYFTQGRESRVRDIGFDGFGAIVAMYFTIKILPKLPKGVVKVGKQLEIV